MFEQWVMEAEKLYKEGYTYTKIGKILNKNRQTVSKHLKAKEENRVIINHNKLNDDMNHDIFKVIDNEEKAYWLGFMYADGYVSHNDTISLSLKEEDFCHIERFKKFLNAKNKIQTKIKDGKYISYSLSLKSRTLKNDLIDKGCYTNKSKILKFPSEKIVPRNLINHFIRGYVDGDGCITTANNGTNVSLEILGSEEFLNGLINIDLFNRNKLYDFKHSDIKRVSYSGAKAMEALNFIYKDATIYLDRKYDNYKKWSCRLETSLQKSQED